MTIIDDYFDLMACVAKADNVLRPNEIASLIDMLNKMGMSSSMQAKYKKMLESDDLLDSDSITSRVAKNIGPSILPWFVRDAFLMAEVDGKISKEEIRVIKELIIKSGFTQKQFIKIKQWGLEFVEHTHAGLKLFNIG